jgi:hypothetical protein
MDDGFDPYRKQIQLALQELVRWGGTKRQAEQEMAKLRQLIIANANMLPESEREALISQADNSFVTGFTNTIRHLFRNRWPNGFTPVQMREELTRLGVDLSTQVNPMASIHTVIRRLIDGGEIEPNGNPSFGGYRWRHVHPLQELSRKPTKK